jgi:hypothetical protein
VRGRQVSRLALSNLGVGDARVDLLFERLAGRPDTVALTDVQVDGRLSVVIEIERGQDEREPA